MSVLTNVTVQQVGSKPVNTKFGPKPTFSFKADNQWFKTGFKKHNLNPGDVVSFSYEEGSYGNEVDPAAITKNAAGVGTPSAPSVGAASPGAVASNSARSGYGNKGVFPIPPLDGQRSIVRQNALTNARELVQRCIITDAVLRKTPAIVQEPAALADTIIAIAKKFEAYTAGDSDAAEVASEMEEAA